MKRLTIISVVHNAWSYTNAFLYSLMRHVDVDCHLIVVDNASTDETHCELQKLGSRAEIITNEYNLGFGPANNQAFERVETEYVLLLNNDTFIFPHFLSTLLDVADENPGIAAFGCNSNCIAAKNPFTGKAIHEDLEKLSSEDPLQRVLEYYGDFEEFSSVFSAVNPRLQILKAPPGILEGWGMLLRTDVIRELGVLFDPVYQMGYMEDSDLCWRLGVKGHEIGRICNVYLHHFSHASFKVAYPNVDGKKCSYSNALRFGERWSSVFRSVLSEEFQKPEQGTLELRLFTLGFPNGGVSPMQFRKLLQHEFLDKPAVKFSKIIEEYWRR